MPLAKECQAELSRSYREVILMPRCRPSGQAEGQSLRLRLTGPVSSFQKPQAPRTAEPPCLAALLWRSDPSVRSTPGAAAHRARAEEAWREFRRMALAALRGGAAGQRLVLCKAGMSDTRGRMGGRMGRQKPPAACLPLGALILPPPALLSFLQLASQESLSSVNHVLGGQQCADMGSHLTLVVLAHTPPALSLSPLVEMRAQGGRVSRAPQHRPSGSVLFLACLAVSEGEGDDAGQQGEGKTLRGSH